MVTPEGVEQMPLDQMSHEQALAEITTLRNQNKLLVDEITFLRSTAMKMTSDMNTHIRARIDRASAHFENARRILEGVQTNANSSGTG
jgi:hypothetical protein